MSKTDPDRIEELQDQISALQQLLLSHIHAFDTVDRATTDATLRAARSQSDTALSLDRNRVAIRIDAMIDAIKELRD